MSRFAPSVGEPYARPRVLLAEDNRHVAAQLRRLLAPAFDIVALVHDTASLIEQTRLLRPDAIVADISMPQQGGLRAVRTILASCPGLPVVFVTIHDSPLMIQEGLASGALGYVVKTDCGEELEPAVMSALGGRGYLSTSARVSLLKGDGS